MGVLIDNRVSVVTIVALDPKQYSNSMQAP